MTATRRALIVAFVLTAAVSTSAGQAGAATPSLLACGTVLNATGATVVLGNNMDGCPGDGLIVAASNVTIDLNGHRISGSDAGVGIRNDGGFPNVTIRGGTVSDFETGVTTSGLNAVVKNIIATDNELDGISATNTIDARISRNITARNADDGISLAGGDGDIVAGNTLSRNEDDGIEVGTSASPTVAGNRALGNLASGLFLNGVSDPVVRSNKLALNRIDGLIAQLVTGARIERNTIVGNEIIGVRLSTDVTGNTLAENRITGNGQDGVIVVASSNVVRSNTVSANTSHGIWVQGGMFNKVIDNDVNENGADGIQLSVATTVRGNRANANGYLNGVDNDDDVGWGIDDDSGLSSGGATNTAAHNDVAAQCAPASLCDVGPASSPATLVGCDAEIARDTRVRNNLLNCPSNGLRIVDNGVDLNLGGHRIDGFFADFGVASLIGHARITVRNGVINNFREQVRIQSGIGRSRDIKVTGIYASDEENILSPAAMRLQDVTSGSVSGNTLAGSGSGVTVSGTSRDVSVQKNLMVSSAGGGVDGPVARVNIGRNTVAGSIAGVFAGTIGPGVAKKVRLSSNRILGVRNAGVSISDAVGVKVNANTIFGPGVGMELFSDADQITITENTVRGSEGDGIVVDGSTNIRVTDNVLAGNDERGVLIQSGATVAVTENQAVANGSHGIDTTSGAARIFDNVANANGFLSTGGSPDNDSGLGILGNIATRGSGNRAKGNDDTSECSPARLC